MKQECRQCRTTTDSDAPYCDACGCEFTETPTPPRGKATWKGRAVAIACGLVAGVILKGLLHI